jgi:hypothetical protein
VVNFTDRYGMPRRMNLSVPGLPPGLDSGRWREWTIDATHSNAWHDAKSAELTETRAGAVSGNALTWSAVLPANSITLVEVIP